MFFAKRELGSRQAPFLIDCALEGDFVWALCRRPTPPNITDPPPVTRNPKSTTIWWPVRKVGK